MTIDVHFIDSGRRSDEKPDSAFPNGRIADAVGGAMEACCFNLPYPAPRCGRYRVECRSCPATHVAAVNGRADDPRMIVIACKRRLI